MTREEAREIILNTAFIGRSQEDIDTAIEIAAKALDQEPTTKNNLEVEKIIDEIEKEFEKVDIPIMVKLTLFAKVQNALYKCAELRSSEIPTSSTTKNDLGVDAVSRKAVINQIFYSTDNNGDVVLGSVLRERIARLPSVTPQLSSGLEKNSKKLEKNFGELDCISRKAILDELEKWDWQELYLPIHFKQMLDELPTVTPQEQKTGHWIVAKGGSYLGMRNGCCSNCKDFYTNDWNVMNYCPNCGAKMVEPQESEDKE